MNVANLELQLFAQHLVEGAERLVHEQHAGLKHDAACERDALLLTARELVGPAVGEVAHLDEVEHRVHALNDFLLRDPLASKPKSDVLEHRHVRKQRVLLKHHAEPTLMGRRSGDVDAINLDLASVGLRKAGDDVEQG